MKNISLVKGLFCLVFICLLAAFQGYSQKTGLYFRGNRQHISIPFEMYNNLIVVKVKYNNFITLNFILDTGVKTAILTDQRVALLLSPKFLRPIKIGGLGNGQQLDAFVATGLTFAIEGLKGEDQIMLVLTNDVFSLSKFLGKDVHGILGYEIFRRFVVEIDYRYRIIRLHEPDSYVYKGKGEIIPISVEDTKPFVNTEVVMDGKKVPAKLIVDTGAGHALSLYVGTHPNIHLPEKTVKSFLGKGLSGDIMGDMGRVSSFQIGSFKFNNVVTSFPDSLSIGEGLKTNERQGNLGGDILNRFKVIFDYKHNRMILQKRKRNFTVFHLNMAGIEFISEGPDLNQFYVDRVRKESPAGRKGIQPGDHLITINGKPAEGFSLSELNSLFQSKPGRKFVMWFTRGDKQFRCKLRLEECI